MATVAVAAPDGIPGAAVNGLTAAVAAQAYFGTVRVSENIAGITARVAVAAPLGTVSASVAGPAAHVTAQAPLGTVGSTAAGRRPTWPWRPSWAP